MVVNLSSRAATSYSPSPTRVTTVKSYIFDVPEYYFIFTNRLYPVMRKKILLALLVSISLSSWGQQDSLTLHLHPSKKMERQTSLRRKWDGLIPKQTKLQYAGSMGMFSQSIGWYYGKHKRWETDFFLGFIPPLDGMDGHITTTLKQTYSPWKIKFGQTTAINPLSVGIYINKIFGEDFWRKLPERYPDKYYFWMLNTRINLFAGQVFSLKTDRTTPSGNELSFFYEFSTNDLYIISAVDNRTLSLLDIVGLSFGIRYRFL